MSEVQTSNWSETAASNSAVAPNGAPEGMAPSGVNDTMREMMAAIRRWFGRSNGIDESEALIASAGTATAITVAYSNAPASLFTGLECAFKVTTTCGADPTLNVNALGAKNIQKFDGAYINLVSGDIVATQHVKVKYDGTLDKWILRDNKTRHPVSFFAHKNGTNQTGVTSATDVTITFSTEDFDVGSLFASNAWVPPAGKVKIGGQITWLNTNGVDNETLEAVVYKNGAQHRRFTGRRAGATSNQSISLEIIESANGTDSYTLVGRKGSAGDGAVSGTDDETYFYGFVL